MKTFSKLTIGLGIYIVISASFMLRLRNFLVESFGEEVIKLEFFLLFLLAAAFFITYIVYNKLPVYRVSLSVFVFALAYLFMLWQPFFAEKLHIPEYGALGFLALKDLSRQNPKRIFNNIIYALCFVALVGSLDEAFQWVLPDRVFEVRDIVTNVISGFLGALLYLINRPQK